jgi:hypothetical protein
VAYNCVTAKIREEQADAGENEQASLGNPRDPRGWETVVTIRRFGLEGHISPLTFGGPPVGAVIALSVNVVPCNQQHARTVRKVKKWLCALEVYAAFHQLDPERHRNLANQSLVAVKYLTDSCETALSSTRPPAICISGFPPTSTANSPNKRWTTRQDTHASSAKTSQAGLWYNISKSGTLLLTTGRCTLKQGQLVLTGFKGRAGDRPYSFAIQTHRPLVDSNCGSSAVHKQPVVSFFAALILRGAVLLLSVNLSPVLFLVKRVHKSGVFRRVPVEPARRWPEPREAALSGRHAEKSVSWRAARAESRKSESCVKH